MGRVVVWCEDRGLESVWCELQAAFKMHGREMRPM